jgi:hypothetical protein
MKKFIKVSLIILTTFIFLFEGCGVSQEEYSQVYNAFIESRAQVAQLQTDYKNAQYLIDELLANIDRIEAQYELSGNTTTETAQKIVRWYYKTHVYSEYDSYVCADMAMDVWDMLKAQGIHAFLLWGNVQKQVQRITDANHVWVQVEVSPGKYLALDPTSGDAIL